MGQRNVFGKWIGRSARKDQLSPQSLAALGPYRHLSAAELSHTLDLVERIPLSSGLLNGALPTDRHLFLESGSIQIQTHTGYVLLLMAGTPQARFPMPLKPRVVSLYAAEPGSLLSIPRTPTLSPNDGTAPPPNPALTAEENEAFAQLRTYFRTQHAELPSLPDLALKIGKAIDDPNNANEDIARLIQLDPSLSARLISVVNSAAFGGFNRITSINQASARLGRNKVRSLVYSCLLKSIFNTSSTPLKRHMEALWQHSVHVAALAFVLGRETPGIDAEQALLAGLIHDIGSVAVIGGINRFPVLARRQEVIDYAIASLRIEVGVHILRHWRLGDEFGDVITDAENWQRVGSAIPDNTDVVILSQLHALIGSAGQGRLPRIDEVPAFHKLARGQLTPRHSLSILDEADADVREVRALIGGS